MDIANMTPEEFVALMKRDSDREVRATIDAAGADVVLDRVFSQMADRFLPEKAGGRTATVQWKVEHDGDVHPYVLRIDDDTCTTERGTAEERDATIKVDAVRFLRIAAGQANPTKLLLTRKLKVGGDVILAKQLDTFFSIPR
jgi:putative sterol carrier protein